MSNGYTGLAFPMRLSNRGGLKLTTTSATDYRHIEESIRQILLTSVGERVMEIYFGSKLSTHIFDPTDESSYSLIKHEVVEMLSQFEPRIAVTTSDVSLYDKYDEELGENCIYITVAYTVVKYDREGSVTVNIGGTN